MTVLLGLLAALSVGTSDFLGGLASRRANPVVVTAASSLAGFPMVFLAGLVVVGEVRVADVAWGAFGGVALGAGLVSLYAGYARMRVGIAAPVAGVGAAALPVMVESLLGNDVLSPTAITGVLLGLLAIGLVSIARSEQQGTVGGSVLYGLGGAAGIGTFFLCLAYSGEDSGLWPIAAARASGFAVLAVIIAARWSALSTSPRGRANRRTRSAGPSEAVARAARELSEQERESPPRGAKGSHLLADGLGVWPHVIGIAALVTAGNALFLTATRVGSTSVAAVLTALFPAVTVFWAWVVFRERLRRVQMLGLGVALVAVALIAAG